MSLPMSLRTTSGERAYQFAKDTNSLKSLYEEERIHEFGHWFVIKNRFPYDAVYQVCDMLIPIREDVVTRNDLNDLEKWELETIINYYCEPTYDQIVENMSKNRSVKNVYHLHLLTFIPERKDTDGRE